MLRASSKQIILVLIEKYKANPEKLKRLVPLYTMGLQNQTDYDELRGYCATESELKTYQLDDDSSDRLLVLVDTFLKNRVAQDTRMRKTENCTNSATVVYKTFCNDEKPNPVGSPKREEFLNSAPILKLFAQPGCRENLVFSIVIPELHFFVIIKLNDGKNSCYRVYHSWSGLFSLGTWLGLDPWPTCEQLERFKFQDFNKFLNVEEIRNFMKLVNTIWEHNYKQFQCTDCDIFINEFNPHKCISAKTLLTDNPKERLHPPTARLQDPREHKNVDFKLFSTGPTPGVKEYGLEHEGTQISGTMEAKVPIDNLLQQTSLPPSKQASIKRSGAT